MSTNTKKDQAQEHVERARETASSAVDKARETAGTVVDKAKDVASHVGQAASTAASYVGEKAGNVATAIGHKAEGATASVGRGMENLGEKIREKGPESGFLGRATETVAGALEHGGEYLEEKKLSGMGRDLTDLIRNNPIPALLVGIGLGFLLARTMRS